MEFIFVCFTQQGAERIILKDIRRAQPIQTTDTKSASFLGFVGILCIAALSFQSLANQNAAVVEKQSLRADVMQSEVESALGIATAQISVRIQRGNSIENYIPWLAKTTPIIRIALPQNWIDQRSKQVGGSDASMQMLMDLVYKVEPTAIVEIVFVQNIPVATATANTSEPSPKQIAIIAGLLALLLSGSFIDRRRRKEEICIVRYEGTPTEEALAILQMEHSIAKCAIDALKGTRKIEVLHEIIGLEEIGNELPIVEVAKEVQATAPNCS